MRVKIFVCTVYLSSPKDRITKVMFPYHVVISQDWLLPLLANPAIIPPFAGYEKA